MVHFTKSKLTLYRMGHLKQTPRKRVGPKGVPRNQLAPRSEQASSSHSHPHEEIEKLSTKLDEATRDRMLNVMQIGKLQTQLANQK